MNQRLLVVWAAGASVVAISALSYIAGKHASIAPSSTTVTSLTEDAVTEPGGEGRAAMPVYEIPASFEHLPTQWRAATNNSAQGYVALFDPQRRDLLVEKCAHPGYSPEKARSGQLDMTFCQPVLRAQLNHLTQTEAIGTDRAGNPVQVVINARLEQSPPRLRLKFGDHDAALTPGSKNDYFQELEALPAIAEQKDKFMQAMMEQAR